MGYKLGPSGSVRSHVVSRVSIEVSSSHLYHAEVISAAACSLLEEDTPTSVSAHNSSPRTWLLGPQAARATLTSPLDRPLARLLMGTV